LAALKITGFSSYLHPIDEETVIGFGEETDVNGTILGLKITVFDMTVPTKPVVLYTHNIEREENTWLYSEASWDFNTIRFV
jgi:uncharacterized secreted protein with C-terminal beta-propeller domain